MNDLICLVAFIALGNAIQLVIGCSQPGKLCIRHRWRNRRLTTLKFSRLVGSEGHGYCLAESMIHAKGCRDKWANNGIIGNVKVCSSQCRSIVLF